jgi:hypothetical protein
VDRLSPRREVGEQRRPAAPEDLLVGRAHVLHAQLPGVHDPQHVLDAGRDPLEVRVGAPQRLVLAGQRIHQRHQHQAAQHVERQLVERPRVGGEERRSAVPRDEEQVRRGVAQRQRREPARRPEAPRREDHREQEQRERVARAEQRIEQPAQGGRDSDRRRRTARELEEARAVAAHDGRTRLFPARSHRGAPPSSSLARPTSELLADHRPYRTASPR